MGSRIALNAEQLEQVAGGNFGLTCTDGRTGTTWVFHTENDVAVVDTDELYFNDLETFLSYRKARMGTMSDLDIFKAMIDDDIISTDPHHWDDLTPHGYT